MISNFLQIAKMNQIFLYILFVRELDGEFADYFCQSHGNHEYP